MEILSGLNMNAVHRLKKTWNIVKSVCEEGRRESGRERKREKKRERKREGGRERERGRKRKEERKERYRETIWMFAHPFIFDSIVFFWTEFCLLVLFLCSKKLPEAQAHTRTYTHTHAHTRTHTHTNKNKNTNTMHSEHKEVICKNCRKMILQKQHRAYALLCAYYHLFGLCSLGCVHGLCSWTVFMGCVHGLCSWAVFMVVVHDRFWSCSRESGAACVRDSKHLLS